MNTIDYSKKIPAKIIDADIESFHGLSFVTNYIAVRSEATPEELENAYDAMHSLQKQEIELEAKLKAISDAARQAEVKFHEAVLAMKETVRGQFGPNSDEAAAIGYKKKSEYKRRRRSVKATAS
ncbi:hypothetical protein C7271_13170 [filamentous cyanobacterium CCP5]|nr:hypothetical protein C7271_13170 [filamentous cyanobacterium CCP5]